MNSLGIAGQMVMGAPGGVDDLLRPRPGYAAAQIESAQRQKEEAGGLGNIHVESGVRAWLRPRYKHIVVDEAQDLYASHWKCCAPWCPSAKNDLFLAGDTHQRIYDNQVTLGTGHQDSWARVRRLTLNYRTTREILGSAIGVLSGEQYDDLDGDQENLAGYRWRHGSRPVLHWL